MENCRLRQLCLIFMNRIKNKIGDIVFTAINTAVMVLFSLIMLYPMWYVVVASLSDANSLMASSGPIFLPIKMNLAAYKAAFSNPLLLSGYSITLFVVVCGTFLGVLFTFVAAYFFSRRDVKLQKPLMVLLFITMYFSGGIIPFYFTVKDVGLNNSVWALIIPTIMTTYNMIIVRTSMYGIPASLEEAAEIDGANHLTILFKVVFPLSKATLAVIALYYAVDKWNAWFNAMIFIKDRQKWPLQLVLREILVDNATNSMMSGGLSSEDAFVSETIKYATIVISTLPILCVYPFIQKYFVGGIMIGAVKG